MFHKPSYNDLLSDAINIANTQIKTIRIGDYLFFQQTENEWGSTEPTIYLDLICGYCYKILHIEEGYFHKPHDYKLPSLTGANIVNDVSKELIRLENTKCGHQPTSFFDTIGYTYFPALYPFAYPSKGSIYNTNPHISDYHMKAEIRYRILDNTDKSKLLNDLFKKQQVERKLETQKEEERKQREANNRALEAEIENIYIKLHNK